MIDPLIEANQESDAPSSNDLPAKPRRTVAVVTCMDCRIDPLHALGLDLGDAHIIRNAGGLITPDVIRSLAISQHKLDTSAIMLIQHTCCGLASFSDEQFRSNLEQDTGSTPPWPSQPFGEQEHNVRDGVAAMRTSPFIPYREEIRGFIFDVDTGRIHEVSC